VARIFFSGEGEFTIFWDTKRKQKTTLPLPNVSATKLCLTTEKFHSQGEAQSLASLLNVTPARCNVKWQTNREEEHKQGSQQTTTYATKALFRIQNLIRLLLSSVLFLGCILTSILSPPSRTWKVTILIFNISSHQILRTLKKQMYTEKQISSRKPPVAAQFTRAQLHTMQKDLADSVIHMAIWCFIAVLPSSSPSLAAASNLPGIPHGQGQRCVEKSTQRRVFSLF